MIWGESDQGRKWLKPEDPLKGECPSPTLLPYLPSAIGIAPGSVHQVLSHCYSVHPRLSTHRPRLYPYHSSVLTLWDSLVRILLHRVRGCDPCMSIHCQIPPQSLVGYCIFGIFILEDGEIHLHASSFLSMSSTSCGMSGSVWLVRPRWQWGSHG